MIKKHSRSSKPPRTFFFKDGHTKGYDAFSNQNRLEIVTGKGNKNGRTTLFNLR